MADTSGAFADDAAARAESRGRRVRVRGGKRLVREPAVRDEAAGSGRVHDVAAPEGVDSDERFGGRRVVRVQGHVHFSPTLRVESIQR